MHQTNAFLQTDAVYEGHWLIKKTQLKFEMAVIKQFVELNTRL